MTPSRYFTFRLTASAIKFVQCWRDMKVKAGAATRTWASLRRNWGAHARRNRVERADTVMKSSDDRAGMEILGSQEPARRRPQKISVHVRFAFRQPVSFDHIANFYSPAGVAAIAVSMSWLSCTGLPSILVTISPGAIPACAAREPDCTEVTFKPPSVPQPTTPSKAASLLPAQGCDATAFRSARGARSPWPPKT